MNRGTIVRLVKYPPRMEFSFSSLLPLGFTGKVEAFSEIGGDIEVLVDFEKDIRKVIPLECLEVKPENEEQLYRDFLSERNEKVSVCEDTYEQNFYCWDDYRGENGGINIQSHYTSWAAEEAAERFSDDEAEYPEIRTVYVRDCNGDTHKFQVTTLTLFTSQVVKGDE